MVTRKLRKASIAKFLAKRDNKEQSTPPESYIHIFDKLPKSYQAKGIKVRPVQLTAPVRGKSSRSVIKYISLSSQPMIDLTDATRVVSGTIHLPLQRVDQVISGSWITISDEPIPGQDRKGMVRGTVRLPNYGRYGAQLRATELKHLTISKQTPSFLTKDRDVIVGKFLDPRHVPLLVLRGEKSKTETNMTNGSSTAEAHMSLAAQETLSKVFAIAEQDWRAGHVKLLSPAEARQGLEERIHRFQPKLEALEAHLR